MRWVTIRKFMGETGLSDKATRSRIDKRVLAAAKQGKYWMIDIDAYYESLEAAKKKIDNIVRFPFNCKKEFNAEQHLKLLRWELRQNAE